MTTDNKNSNDIDQNSNLDQNSDNQEDNGFENQTVPLNTFLDKKKELKDVKTKLAEYQARDKKLEEDKLLEEKKYQELIQNKDKELEEFKSQLDLEKRNSKLEKLKNKISNELNKNNAIDSDDALKFIIFDDLLDSEDSSNDIKNRVKDLVQNKSYLFSTKSKERSNTENGQPSGNDPKGGNPGQVRGKIDPTLASLAQKFSKT